MKIRHEQQHQLLYRSWLILLLALLIALWGLLGVYRTLALTGQWQHFLLRQSVWLAAAAVVYLVLRKLRFETLLNSAIPLTALGAAVMLFLPLFGLRVNGMHGWYSIAGVTVQPSELLKGFYILSLIKILHSQKLTPLQRFTAALAVMAGFAFLLLMQPDFGTMTVFLAGGAGALYFCRVKVRYLVLTTLAAIPVAIAAIMSHSYMLARIINFLDPSLEPTGGGWHGRQFCIAAARGGWFGVKSDMAVWSNSFLPLAHNDSIFAAMCEMLGFCGALLLLLLYGAWFWQMFALSSWRRDPLRCHLIDSMACMILMQTLLHILVNLSLLPTTGITLPLVSYGGSSLAGTMIMLAIINIAGRMDDRPAIKKLDR